MDPIETIEIRELKARVIKGDYRILRIDTRFDVEQLRRVLDDVLTRFKLVEKDGYDKYLSIGLQYQDDSDPLYDAVQQTGYLAPDGTRAIFRNEYRSFRKVNEIGERFRFVFDAYQGIRLFRGRMLQCLPGMIMSPHTDGNPSSTLHVPLRSEIGNRFHIDGKTYYLPPDGSSYLVNTALVHSIENHSDQDRIHLTFRLYYLSFIPLLDKQLEKLYEFLGGMTVDEVERFSEICHHVKRRDGYRCQFCGDASDYLYVAFFSNPSPESLRGSDSVDQAFTLCEPCYFGPEGLISKIEAKEERRELVISDWLAARTSPQPLPLYIERRCLSPVNV